MNDKSNIPNKISWILGIIIFVIGVLNIFLVHSVPGIVYLLLSSIYFPPINAFLWQRFHFSMPFVIKIILFIVIMWFTLGISDLGDMID